jgi:hypothetical protein
MRRGQNAGPGRAQRRRRRVTLVFEAIGGDKVRVECSSWDSSRVTLAHEALQAVALGHVTRSDRPAECLNFDPTGIAHAGYGPETK